MPQSMLTENIVNGAVAEAKPAQRATPLLFELREELPDSKEVRSDTTSTGGCTDLPGGEVWDEDYDAG